MGSFSVSGWRCPQSAAALWGFALRQERGKSISIEWYIS